MSFFTYRFVEIAKKLFTPLASLLIVLFGMAATVQAQSVDWLVNIDNFGPDPVPAGADIDYTIGVTNNGFDSAPATTISVDIPLNAQYVGATGAINGCVSVPASGVGPATVTCNVPALAGLASESMVMTVRSFVEGTITTTASVPTSSAGVNDTNTANNIEPIISTILKGSDIGVTMTAPATAASGSTVPLVFEAINNGPNINDSFDLEFPIPTGITNITPPAGCVLTGATYTCTITGPLLVGETVTRTFTGQISAAASSTVTPTVSVVNSAPGDPISSNNTDLANIAITAGSDVSISKTRSPSGTLLVGDTATFTLGAQSTGDNPTGLEILDTLPANYLITGVTAPGWACSVAGQNVACNRATGAGAGANISLGSITIETTVVSAGTPTNTATISSAGPVDSDLTNNSATDGGATIAEPVVDLSAVKTGPSPALAVTGQPYDYSISTSNLGNTPFFGTLNMVDHVPAGMTVTGAALNGWTCDALPVSGATDLNCSRTYTSGAPLGVGATTPSIVLTAEFTGTGTISNGLTVGSPDSNVVDVNAANDTTTYDVDVATAVNSANVGAIKTAAVNPLLAGDVQTYILEITNTGASASLNVEVSDTLSGLINNSVGATGAGYISHSISSGVATGLTCSTTAAGATARQLDCNITTLPVCTPGVDCPEISVMVRPGGNADLTRSNTFSAISQTTPDPDLSDNSGSASFVVTALTDVTVSKTATPDPVAVGQNVTYVVTATNVANGLSEAGAVTITDTLPSDMTFISATPSTGSCGVAPAAGSVTSAVNNQVVCNLGTIGNGGQQTVTIIARPNFALRTQTITNNVVVVTTTPETDATNNAASVDIVVEDPDVDILIEKSDSIDPLPVGDNTVYTLTITNAGPSASENIVVTDSMPTTRINYQSHVVSGGGTCSTVPAVGSLGGTLICSWPYLEAGAFETIQVTAGGIAKGSTTNTAVVSSTEIINNFDRNDPNNSTTETTTLRTKTDIEVTSKVASVGTVDLNENFTFLATVHVNTGVGLAEADDVVFSDTLPAGMQLTGTPVAVATVGTASSTTCTGVSGGTSFTCDLGTVSSNGTVEITIPVEVVTVAALPDTLTNTATVSTSSYEAPSDVPNNTNGGNINVGSSSISGTVFRDFADDSGITAGDTFVSGVPITLTGTSFDGQPISITVNTDASGFYEFPFLPEGTYQISRGAVAEPYLTDGTNTAGSEGGAVSSPTLITAIALPAATAGTDYLFPLIPQARVGIAKQVSGAVSTNPDGSFNTTFDLVVENFSLEALDNMVVTDPLAGAAPLFGTYQALGTPATDPMAAGSYTMLSAPSGTCGSTVAGYDGSGTQAIATGFSLASGATCTLSISIRVQPTVPLPPVLASGGRYENQATVTGEGSISGQTSATNPELIDTSDDGTSPDPSGNGVASDPAEGDPTPVIPSISPAIALVKMADVSALSSPPVVGEIITYTFAVTNTGNVNLTGVSVADAMPDIMITGSPIASLAVGATDSTITATYALKVTDINAGQVQNTATTQGTDPYGTVVNDTSGTSVANDTPTTVPLTQAPAIALIKVADASLVQSPAQVADTINYTFTVENTGNVTLTNVTLTDALAGISLLGGPIPTMDPGDIDTVTFTASYALQQSDIDAAIVVNTATATGTPPTGPNVSDVSGTDNTNDTTTDVALVQNPDIALIKTADVSALQSPPQAGDIITYGFTVENTGNVTLTNVTLTDALAGIMLLGGPIPTMAPGDINSVTFTATYAVTLGDLAAGIVSNTATATGTPPTGPNVSDVSGTDNTNDTPTDVTLASSPSIALIKTADASALQSPPQVGDIITFAFTVENTGNVTLTNIMLADPLTGIMLLGGPIPTMDPGDIDAVTFTATYALTLADLDASEVTNTATATGTPPTGPNVTDVSGTDNTNDTPTVVPLVPAPSIALIKTADVSALQSPPQAGDTITYGFTVENTGNVTLTNVTLADSLAGIVLTGGPIPTMEPGDIDAVTFTATYALTQADVDMGIVSNTATATGTPPTGPNVSDVSGTDNTNDTPIDVALVSSPSIALIKTANDSAFQSPPQAGDVITYGFTVENTGNVTLTNVTLTDALAGIVLTGGPIPTMAPGDVDALTFTATYTLTLADMAAGEVSNTATATGTPPTGPDVSDVSGTDNTNDTPTLTPIEQVPSIVLQKFVDAAPHLAGSVVGDLVEYTFTVTNAGNIPLNNVMITDALAGVTVSGGPIPVLNPGAVDTLTFTATYNLIAADITAGEVINTATVTGDWGPGNTLQVSDDDSVRLEVGKIEAIPEVFPAFTTDGGTTTSMLASDLLNNAQATLTNVNITVITTDPALTLDPATGLITLAPGNPAGPYEVTYEICSAAVPTLCDTTTETVTQGALPGIETEKTQVFTDNGDGRDDVGDTVTYTITTTNTGNTPLSGVTLADTLTDQNGAPLTLTSGPTFVSATAGSPEGALEIGEVATYTATFVLDLQAVNAGGVSNTATATGLPVFVPGVPGTPEPVSDVSDDGIDTDGNTVDDPTELTLVASPVTSGLTMTKTTPQEIVMRGSVVPYTIIIDNSATHVAGPYNIVDTLPPGFIYVPNTATLDGVAAVVTVEGAVITWPNVTVPAAGQVVVTLDARILTGANPGAHVNRVSLRDPATGVAVLDDATALVRIMPEAVFDCVDVIGKVFDDVNGNGYQDAPGAAPNSAAITDQTYYGGKGGKLVVTPAPQNEDGIPGVRLVTVDGLVITTDAFGRYSVPCAALPADGGDNFIIKLDPRSLPTGYSLTTENPRVTRVTPGMMSEVNFGATLGHLARVDVNNAGFSQDGAPIAALSAGMTQLAASLVDNPATVVIAYHISLDAGAAEVALARQRMNVLKDQLRQEWRRVGQGPLNIQTLVVREGA